MSLTPLKINMDTLDQWLGSVAYGAPQKARNHFKCHLPTIDFQGDMYSFFLGGMVAPWFLRERLEADLGCVNKPRIVHGNLRLPTQPPLIIRPE